MPSGSLPKLVEGGLDLAHGGRVRWGLKLLPSAHFAPICASASGVFRRIWDVFGTGKDLPVELITAFGFRSQKDQTWALLGFRGQDAVDGSNHNCHPMSTQKLANVTPHSSKVHLPLPREVLSFEEQYPVVDKI